MAIDFSQLVGFSNGVAVLNCTPHEIRFLDGGREVVAPPCGATLLARAMETPAEMRGNAQLVRTVFQTSPQGLEELEIIEAELPGVLVVGSIISAQAYAGRCVGMIPAPGFERAAPPDKRYACDKFTIF